MRPTPEQYARLRADAADMRRHAAAELGGPAPQLPLSFYGPPPAPQAARPLALDLERVGLSAMVQAAVEAAIAPALEALEYRLTYCQRSEVARIAAAAAADVLAEYRDAMEGPPC